MENLNASDLQGWTPYLRHARATVAFPIFKWPASSLDDQCVTPYCAGGADSVAAMIRSSSTRLGLPARGASTRPARPLSAYRLRHFHTDVVVVPTSAAIRAFAIPSEACRTIRALKAMPARIDVDLVHDTNSSRSPERSTNAGAGELAMANPPKHTTV